MANNTSKKVRFLVQLFVIKNFIKRENPYKTGLKRLLRDLFPVYYLQPHIAKTIDKCDFLELEETNKIVTINGVKYEKVYKPNKYGKEPLYIKVSDVSELSRGNYYPYMEVIG